MDSQVYGALVAAPIIGIACYTLYQYKSKGSIFTKLNLPSDDGYYLSGLFTKVRNVIYRNTLQDRLWKHVKMRSEEGNPESVLAAFDEYCYNYEWTWAIGDKKGAILRNVVAEAAPNIALELGTFCGYSAVITALNMPPDGKLLTVEANPKSAEIARKIINRAGFGERVTVVNGYSYDIIPELRSKYNVETLDLIFLDHVHYSGVYVSDLKLLEKSKYLRQGTVVFADNIKGEGRGDFSQYIRGSGDYECQYYDADLEYIEGVNDGMERGIYKGKNM